MYTISKDKVRDTMRIAGIKTQKQLAEKMNITTNQLSMLLSPKFNPIKSNAKKLCEVLNVSLDDILVKEQLSMYFASDAVDIEEKEEESSFDKLQGDDDNDFIDVQGIIPLEKYNVVELFAGAGGLALGLEKSGFNTIGLVELDKYACQSLRTNRPNWNVIEEDIMKVTELGISNYIDTKQEIDLLSGGYPCQAFSYAGKKRGLDDVRGTMFYYYSKILSEIRPKMFLAENVRGLVNHDNGRTLATMIEVFSDLGYTVKWKVLSALNYNVAQKRERIVIVGIRNDLIEQHNVCYKFPKPYGKRLTLKDILKDVPVSDGAKYPESKKRILDLVPPGGYWRDLPEHLAREYMGKSYFSGGGRTGMARRLSWDEPSLTLTCSPAQKQTERCHPSETRPFTVREYARIQCFPDSWRFDGSTANQYKQIGNAVSVNFAHAMGLSIIDILNQLNSKQL
ncbi:DNA (cytosine-5-)-methyltransferase [Paenibacillus sinopodophylli]|uniref:DNA (cytosine-5-)-methyltransferase n=1 Tax=Paenibacillus sinopodophylli TaxID=1837342 RepID=UPI001FE84B3B|nr:DNA (cytosine-5-)-methyltransferase [Paenibacillus sinopodophylli]